MCPKVSHQNMINKLVTEGEQIIFKNRSISSCQEIRTKTLKNGFNLSELIFLSSLFPFFIFLPSSLSVIPIKKIKGNKYETQKIQTPLSCTNVSISEYKKRHSQYLGVALECRALNCLDFGIRPTGLHLLPSLLASNVCFGELFNLLKLHSLVCKIGNL